MVLKNNIKVHLIYTGAFIINDVVIIGVKIVINFDGFLNDERVNYNDDDVPGVDSDVKKRVHVDDILNVKNIFL